VNEQTTKNECPIIGLKVSGFQGVEAVEMEVGPEGVTPISGPNKSGKSSVLRAIAAAVNGRKVLPDDPVRHGEERAEVEIEFESPHGVLVLQHVYTDPDDPKKQYLKLKMRDSGAAFSSARSMLDEWFGTMIDPFAFWTLPDADKTRLVMGEADLPIEEWAAKEREIMERRRDARRDHDKIADALTLSRAELEGAEVPKGDRAELEKAIAGAAEAAAERVAIEGKIATIIHQGKEAVALREKYSREHEELQRRIKDVGTLIETRREEHKAAAAELEAMPEPVDVVAAQTSLQAIEAHERGVERIERLESDEGKTAEFVQSAEAALLSLRTERLEALAGTELGVEGLTYEPAEAALRYNDVPLSQVSGRERWEVALGLAMNPHRKGRLAIVHHGNDLDAEGMAQLHEAAVERGYQVIVERVAERGEGEGVRIYEGRNEDEEVTS